MNVFTKVAAIAALGLAAGSAFADTANLQGNTVIQGQTGSQNRQELEVGVVDAGLFSSGNVTLFNNTISQQQSGSGNVQSAKIGVIDKDVGWHNVFMANNRVSQSQSGTGNRQSLKMGVIE
jgi:hypothetical protein